MKIEDFKKLCKTPEQHIVVDNCICILRVGSELYGTKTPESDSDFCGVFFAPEEYKLGRKGLEFLEFKSNSSSSGKRNSKDDLDCTFYELDKWFGLLENNNPNQLELLFVNRPNIVYSTPYFEEIVKNRDIFISLKLKHSFSGYAYSQISRNNIKSGNQTGRKDKIAEFGFDPKLCSHAVRLYTESIDLLKTGQIEFPLSNNAELLDLKRGLWSYEQFQERCKFYEPLIEKAYLESKLQHSPNHEEIHKLQVKLYRDFYRS